MSFLQNLGVKAEAKRLRPFFAGDEHFLETDVCDLVTVEDHATGRRQAGGRVALSLTSRALYFRPATGRGSDVVRIPYERVIAVDGGRGLTEVVTQLRSYLFRDIGRSISGRDKPTTIGIQVRRLENHREMVDVPGGKVEAVNRPLDESQPSKWLFRTSDGIDLREPAVRDALMAALATPVARLGPLGIE